MFYVALLVFSLATPIFCDEDSPHLEAGGVDIHEVTADNLAEYIDNRWTLLEFYSPICGMCQATPNLY